MARKKTTKDRKPIKQNHPNPVEEEKNQEEEERRKEQEALRLLNEKMQKRQEEYLQKVDALSRQYGFRLEVRHQIVPVPIR